MYGYLEDEGNDCDSEINKSLHKLEIACGFHEVHCRFDRQSKLRQTENKFDQLLTLEERWADLVAFAGNYFYADLPPTGLVAFFE